MGTLFPLLKTPGADDVIPQGEDMEFIELTTRRTMDPPEDSEGSASTVARSVANLLMGIVPEVSHSNAEEAAKGKGVYLGDGLPPVPAKVAAKIDKGEFIDMIDLLPELWPTSKGVEANKKRARKKVENINTWLQCYAAFVAVVATKSPEQVPELMAYMINIIKASQEFEGMAWATYDVAYRRQAAATGHKRWSKINPSLYALCFTGKAKMGLRCDYCMSHTHESEACTEAGDEDPGLGKRVKAVESAVLALASQPPKRDFRSQETCRLFNEKRCKFRYCRFRHVCQTCGGNHPVSDCTPGMKRVGPQPSSGSGPRSHVTNRPY